jgi:hypothetical protein
MAWTRRPGSYRRSRSGTRLAAGQRRSRRASRGRSRLLLIVAASSLLLLLILWPQQISGRYNVVGSPSISADFIDRVLAAYNSPAAGKGQALYDDGVTYNIDPVYALAFFLEESHFGTEGVARVTHSLGNIRATPGYQSYAGYRFYRTWEEGFIDWYRLIAEEYVARRGLSTLDQIVPVYAPAADDNDVAAYIRTLKRAVDTWRSGSLLV